MPPGAHDCGNHVVARVTADGSGGNGEEGGAGVPGEVLTLTPGDTRPWPAIPGTLRVKADVCQEQERSIADPGNGTRTPEPGAPRAAPAPQHPPAPQPPAQKNSKYSRISH